MWLWEIKRFAPNGARIKFLTVVLYNISPLMGRKLNLQNQTNATSLTGESESWLARILEDGRVRWSDHLSRLI
jgi:hypothetical protein